MKFINHQHHHDKLLSLYYNNVSQVQGFSLFSQTHYSSLLKIRICGSAQFSNALWAEKKKKRPLDLGATAAYRTELSMAMTVEEEVVVVVQLRAILNAGEREKTSKASSWFLAMPKWISSNSSRLFDSNKKTSKYSSPHNHSFFSSEKKLDWPVFSMDETLKCGSFWRNTLDGQKNNMIWSFECQVRYIKPIKSKKEDFFVTFFEWQLL